MEPWLLWTIVGLFAVITILHGCYMVLMHTNWLEQIHYRIHRRRTLAAWALLPPDTDIKWTHTLDARPDRRDRIYVKATGTNGHPSIRLCDLEGVNPSLAGKAMTSLREKYGVNLERMAGSLNDCLSASHSRRSKDPENDLIDRR